MSPCEKGDHSELLFCAEVAVRGFKVLVPWGHSATSDVWIVKPQGRPISVQVKRAWLNPKRNGVYGISVANGSAVKTAYKHGDFDLLAAYLPDQNKFVFWGFPEIRGRKRICYTQARADRQPDNWEVLDGLLSARNAI